MWKRNNNNNNNCTAHSGGSRASVAASIERRECHTSCSACSPGASIWCCRQIGHRLNPFKIDVFYATGDHSTFAIWISQCARLCVAHSKLALNFQGQRAEFRLGIGRGGVLALSSPSRKRQLFPGRVEGAGMWIVQTRDRQILSLCCVTRLDASNRLVCRCVVSFVSVPTT